MLRIDTLRVQNFRCFADFRLDLHPEMTVLHGDNGGGKTSVLAALAVGMGAWFSDLGHARRNIWPGESRETTRFLGRYVETVEHYPVRVECVGRVQGDEVRWARSVEREGGRTTTRELAALTGKVRELTAALVQSPEVSLPVLGLYGTQRLFAQRRDTENKQPPRRETRFYGYLDCLNPASNEKQLLQWLYQEAMAEFQTGESPQQYEAVRNAVLRALGGVFIDLRYDAASRQPCLVTAEHQVVPWGRFSDGYHTFVGMVADIAWRAALLNPHLGAQAADLATGIVAIDEIDLHLHPTWQRRVLRDLRRAFPRLQFVVTTHSPQVLGSARREWIRGLFRGATEAEIGASVEGRDSNAILDDVMGASSRDLETTRRLEALFRLIDADDPAARPLLEELGEQLGWDDTVIVRALARVREG